MKVGMIGCGGICGAYLKGEKLLPEIEMAMCADLDLERAEKRVREFNQDIKIVTTEELLANDDIEVVLNITPPGAHAKINMMALEAGKHVYCEKPFAVSLEEGCQVLELAKSRNMKVGCAPDTFLGSGIQNTRKIIDSGAVGKILSGTANCLGHGTESWHKSPEFYYKAGGGPLMDMGPYFITALVSLLGPVKCVTAITGRGFNERTITSEPLNGKKIAVEVETHNAGIMEFESGAIVTVTMSFDTWKATAQPFELHGETGSITIPNPNGFVGDTQIFKPAGITQKDIKGTVWKTAQNSFNYESGRSIGLADMIKGIETGRKFRCNGELACHVLEVMLAFPKSSKSGKHENIESSCERPEALPDGFSGNFSE